ncbi:hypothetical protein [Cyanobium sp. A2C-AMD]|uniref:hypothetical protein n=1 Tax=Cyanobium sp. A2C-AMD TaxID=2823695 RepID=UPI0020CEFBBD|nr:hypothetical protein [Cyanobium sp. A2C-AMD]MCP9876029.1 hypothetical protein [Cyanobium sp. A2C-AMD]
MSPIEQAYSYACQRLDKIAGILKDPYVRITDEQKLKLQKVAYAIEEEWILDPALRVPRG